MIEPFLSAVPVLQRLEDAGFEAFFVGGSVRDYLLSRKINDVDIATSATPDEVKKVFRKTVDTGIQHGTVMVIYDNMTYEITTFRTESEYEDYRRPKEVSFIRSLEEDLKRRDFTMNAMAMDRSGRIIDLFNGQTAINSCLIQTVGLPEHRFREDALRMMRAVRFVSQLSFKMESNTLNSLTKLVSLLEHIAVERKRTEFEKLLSGNNRAEALRILIESGMYKFLPGLDGKKENLNKLLSFDTNRLNSIEMWSVLIYCMKTEVGQIESFLRNWRLPLKEIRVVQHIFAFLRKRLVQEWSVYDLYKANRSTVESVEKLFLVIKGIAENDSIHDWLSHYENLPIKNSKEINVTGEDLLVWYGKQGGPWLGELLQGIEESIVHGNLLNNRDEIKEWVMKCSQK